MKRAYIITLTFQELTFSILKMKYKMLKFYECLLFPKSEFVFQRFYKALANLKIKWVWIMQLSELWILPFLKHYRYDGNKSDWSDERYINHMNEKMKLENGLKLQSLPEESIENSIKASMMKVTRILM